MRFKQPLLMLISFFFMPLLIYAQYSLKPKPLPECKTFLISEVGYLYRVSSFPENIRYYKHQHYFTSNLGVMININTNFSIGATNFVGMDSDGQLRWGLKVRGRRWFGSKSSLDLAVGLNFSDTRSRFSHPAFSSGISLNFRDLFMIEILTELTSYEYYKVNAEGVRIYPHIFMKDTDLAIYTGIKTGSTPGLVGNTLAVLVVAVIFGIYIIGGGD